MDIEISENDKDNYIDLRVVFNILKRGKFFILIFTLISTIFGSIYAIRKPTLWQGSFEIVLDDINQEKYESNLPLLRDIQSEIGLSNNNLDTQVSILRSSSVLKPVYLFALEHKKKLVRM